MRGRLTSIIYSDNEPYQRKFIFLRNKCYQQLKKYIHIFLLMGLLTPMLSGVKYPYCNCCHSYRRRKNIKKNVQKVTLKIKLSLKPSLSGNLSLRIHIYCSQIITIITSDVKNLQHSFHRESEEGQRRRPTHVISTLKPNRCDFTS